MKVKIIEETQPKNLENEINDFLSGLEGEVIDIKYAMTDWVYPGSSEDSCSLYSAMIMYK